VVTLPPYNVDALCKRKYFLEDELRRLFEADRYNPVVRARETDLRYELSQISRIIREREFDAIQEKLLWQ
jgi:hypothetical protein